MAAPRIEAVETPPEGTSTEDFAVRGAGEPFESFVSRSFHGLAVKVGELRSDHRALEARIDAKLTEESGRSRKLVKVAIWLVVGDIASQNIDGGEVLGDTLGALVRLLPDLLAIVGL